MSLDHYYDNTFKCWWPVIEKDRQKAFAEINHGLYTLNKTINHVKNMRNCIQAGGHVGLFSIKLARYFEHVHTFEPAPASYNCLVKNVGNNPAITSYNYGLGAVSKTENLLMSASSGTNKIDARGNLPIQLMTIDSLNLQNVDAIFLDIEAYEVEALTGAVETINRCNPIIQIEELARSKDRISGWLRNMGYRLIYMTGRDSVYER